MGNTVNTVVYGVSCILAITAMLLFIAIGNFRKIKNISIASIMKSFLTILIKPVGWLKNLENVFLEILVTGLFILFFGYAIIFTYVEKVNKYGVLLTIIYVVITIAIVYIILLIIGMVIEKISSFIITYIEGARNIISNLALASLMIPIMSGAELALSLKFDNKYLLYVNLAILIFSIFFIYKAIFLIINKPEYLSSKNYKHSKYIGMIVWLIILVSNVYCAVLVISLIDNNAFSTGGKPVTDWLNLFYFTAYSLISVGFGDISPNGCLGKGMEIILFISGVYYLVVFIGTVLTARVSDKEELYKFVNRRVNLIVSNIDKLLNNMRKEWKVDISRNKATENIIHKVLNEINPNSKSPLAIGYREEYVTWIQYFLISKEQCMDNIKSIYNLIILLEPDLIKILLKIEDSLYFRHLEEINNQDIRKTNNLSFLTRGLTDYIEIINELEQYRKDNLEQYRKDNLEEYKIKKKSFGKGIGQGEAD